MKFAKQHFAGTRSARSCINAPKDVVLTVPIYRAMIVLVEQM